MKRERSEGKKDLKRGEKRYGEDKR